METNFERSEGLQPGLATRKLQKFLELVRNGSTTEEAMEQCQHIPKEKKTPKKIPKAIEYDADGAPILKKTKIPKKKSLEGDPSLFGKIKMFGPKSKMSKLEGKFNKEVNMFDSNFFLDESQCTILKAVHF